MQEARSGEETSPSGKPWSLTGTPLFCAISVLDGEPHTISSALESLFYSMLHWVSNGRFPDALGEPHSTSARAELRLGQMLLARLRWLTAIPPVAQEFVKALHVQQGGHSPAVQVNLQSLHCLIKYWHPNNRSPRDDPCIF